MFFRCSSGQRRELAVRTLTALLFVSILWLGGPANAASDDIAMLTTLKADRLVVLKGERQLVLMRGDRVLKVYRVALGRYAKGRKTREGDAKTPEGLYTVDYRLDSDRSKFHRALHISYPNQHDRALARQRGVDPGGQIMIHGLPTKWSASDVGHPRLDWTQGCIAVTNREIDEIWEMVADGTKIEIHP
jgi:murein L,D-transpeptidase YafK